MERGQRHNGQIYGNHGPGFEGSTGSPLEKKKKKGKKNHAKVRIYGRKLMKTVPKRHVYEMPNRVWYFTFHGWKILPDSKLERL